MFGLAENRRDALNRAAAHRALGYGLGAGTAGHEVVARLEKGVSGFFHADDAVALVLEGLGFRRSGGGLGVGALDLDLGGGDGGEARGLG